MTIDKNDPRLIDYALGELDAKERAAFEKTLAEDKDAWESINEISAVARCAGEALHAESDLALTDVQRAVVEQHAHSPRKRRIVAWVTVAAAASLLIGISISFANRYEAVQGELAAKDEEIARTKMTIARLTSATSDPGRSVNREELDRLVTDFERVQAARHEAERALQRRQSMVRSTGPSFDVAQAGGDITSLGYLEGVERSQAQQASGDGVIEQRTRLALQPGQLPNIQNVQVGGAIRVRGNWYPSVDTMVAAAPEQQSWRFNDIPSVRQQSAPSNTEAYDRVVDNPFLTVVDTPLSTFSIDVDTASYANIRRFLMQGQLPPKDAVRIEEMINYFDYAYEPPTGEHPFAVHVEVAACPWQPGHQLARIGLQGKVLDEGERPPSNLVFLVDVSGSMNSHNKLPLVIESMKLLVDRMRSDDTIALTVYAGSSGLVLPPTSGLFKDAIRNALNNLRAGGSTNGGAGIQLAYQTAKQAFKDGGVNRVILATDGDFNVGTTDRGALTRMVEDHAKSGVFLSVLGYGMGNLKDATMEELSGKGNGNYAYIDTLNEARKVLVEQAAGTLVTIAKDVKIQVDFNPANVQAYRLIGYENRMLAAEDFEDDTKDAGEIGAGHRVTALYELVPAGAPFTAPGNVTDSVYRQPASLSNTAQSGELMQVRLRYKQPDSDTSIPLVVPVAQPMAGVPIIAPFEAASADFQFASAVAAFGMLLRDSPYKGASNYSAVIDAATRSLGADRHGYRAEFVQLVRSANSLRGHAVQTAEEQLRAAERAYQEALENMQRMQQQR